MWVLLGVASAFLLGIYDIFKKVSLQNNAVLPVLFFSTLTCATLFLPAIVISHFHPEFANHAWYIKPQSLNAHLFFLLKAAIVGTSWVFAYFAVKNLPLTIAAPIRASGPLWTLLGAIMIYGEQMNAIQWLGVILTILFYYGLSKALADRGQKEMALKTLEQALLLLSLGPDDEIRKENCRRLIHQLKSPRS